MKASPDEPHSVPEGMLRHVTLWHITVFIAIFLVVWLYVIQPGSSLLPGASFHSHVLPIAKDWAIGALAAAISKTAVAPIERVKLLLQTQAVNARVLNGDAVPYKGAIDCFVRVVREQSVLALWRGNFANVLRYFPTQAFNFTFKNRIKAMFPAFDPASQFWKFFATNLLSGSIAGVLTVLIVYPLDYARTRLATDMAKGGEHEYRGLIDCLTKTVRRHGCTAVYQGLQVSICGIFVYRGVYFGLYDTAKAMVAFTATSTVLNLVLRWGIAQSVTILAGLICYPFDTIRRRLMVQVGVDQPLYRGALHCAQSILWTEGCGGLYKGATSNVLRGMGAALVLVLYDELHARL